MNTALRLLALAALLLGGGGCAADNSPQTNNQASSIPWNRPQSWEGGGALGGLGQQNTSSVGHY